MFAETFIKLVEEEYLNVLENSIRLKDEMGFSFSGKPEFICERVQKFRTWLIMAMRCADLVSGPVGVKPEEVLINAASTTSEGSNRKPLHPNLVEALTLFDRTQFEGIFGERQRLLFEQNVGLKVSDCMFKPCYDHCQFLKKISLYDGDSRVEEN